MKARPNDVEVLSLLAVALDNEKKYTEAETTYLRAIALAPKSASLLNNYGNHLLATGNSAGARSAFSKVVAIDPAHVNANEQLARIALGQNAGREALHCLERIPAGAQAAPAVALLRMRALYVSGRMADANAMVEELTPAAESDARLGFSTGLELAAARQYDKAETFFSRVLESAPGNFDVMYNLGLAASRAGHEQRAHDVLEAARQQRPEDVDTLYNLAAVDAALDQKGQAVELLAHAARLAPQRPEFQLLLAHLTSDLGYYADSRQAWTRYLQLEPGDDTARRERGYTAAILGDHAQSIADLEWYTAKHPTDAIGHYELGMAESSVDVNRAFAELDRALVLNPNLTAATFSRGLLNYQQNKLTAALADLEAANKASPGNPMILDRLGQTYLALGRTVDAVSVSSKAAEFAPQDSRTLLHFGRALAKAGRPDEARAITARVRQLGPEPSRRRGGLVEFLSLAPEEQYSHFRSRVEKAVRDNPQDTGAQVNYLELLLDEGDMKHAAAVAHEIAALAPNEALFSEAGKALLETGQYATAKEFLEQAEAGQNSPKLDLQLAIALSHLVNPRAGLEQLNKIPAAARTSEYYLTCTQMLDAAGQFDNAVAAMNRALRDSPKEPELYRQAAFFLIKNDRIPEAIDLLEEGKRVLPNNPDILLTEATALELAGKTQEAEHLLGEIQNRWPEWPNVWLTHGMILETYRRYEEAHQMIETAVLLGARSAEAYFYLAESTLYTSPDRLNDAHDAIQRALPLAPDDPWVHALAGRIAFERQQYSEAVSQLQQAIQLRPHLVEAHYNLARAYKALGKSRESEAELEQVTMIHQQFPNSEQDSNDFRASLFQIGPLGHY